MLTFTEIDETVLVCTSDGGLVNAVILHADHEVVVIDSLLRPAESRDLAAEAAKFGRLRYLINTHWHSDHCYGNRIVKSEGVTGIAQERYWDTLSRERHVISPNRPQLLDRHQVARPEITFESVYEIDDPFPLKILSMPGHTPDSSVILLPDQKTLVCGDTVLNSGDGRIGIPYFFWGDLTQHAEATEKIDDTGATLLIPGHGLPIGREKILLDGIYLDRLKGLFDDFIRSEAPGTLAEATQKALEAIPATLCLPGTTPEDFWVPRMHELNLERLIRNAWNLGDE